MNEKEHKQDFWSNFFLALIVGPFVIAIALEIIPIVLVAGILAAIIGVVIAMGMVLQASLYGGAALFDKYCFNSSGYGVLIFFVFFILIIPLYSVAHSGRTDSSGGHFDRSTGNYHYHGLVSQQETGAQKKTSKIEKSAPKTDFYSFQQNFSKVQVPVHAEASDEILLGKLLENKTYVPLRQICEALNAKIEWSQFDKQTRVTLSNGKCFVVATDKK